MALISLILIVPPHMLKLKTTPPLSKTLNYFIKLLNRFCWKLQRVIMFWPHVPHLSSVH
jgi:hypothetical protein